MSGDEYYIKLLDSSRKVIWENYVVISETDTNECSNDAFIEIIRYYLPQEKFNSEANIMKIYGIAPSVGDLVLLREIDIVKYRARKNNGESTIVPGVKYDDNKPLVGDCLAIFGRAIMAVGECILKGQEKYPEIDNWKRVKDAERRYTNALIRHLIKHLTGIEKDKESGLTHIQHVAWNALAICELYLEKKDE